jgi:hypothetical protein
MNLNLVILPDFKYIYISTIIHTNSHNVLTHTHTHTHTHTFSLFPGSNLRIEAKIITKILLSHFFFLLVASLTSGLTDYVPNSISQGI